MKKQRHGKIIKNKYKTLIKKKALTRNKNCTVKTKKKSLNAIISGKPVKNVFYDGSWSLYTTPQCIHTAVRVGSSPSVGFVCLVTTKRSVPPGWEPLI